MTEKKPKKLTLKEKKALLMKDIDLVSIKKNIIQEITFTNQILNPKTTIPNRQLNHTLRKFYDRENYNTKYSHYITEEFNAKCLNLIISFIHCSMTLPPHLRIQKNLHKELITVVKTLMMNELEITLFTLNIDEIGWEIKEYPFSVHLLFIGIMTKYHSNQSIEAILKHCTKENKDFLQSYLQWKNRIRENFFSLSEINNRYRKLNLPFNSSCAKNYIDYNCVVDKIILLSHPYGDDCQGGKIKVKEQNVINEVQIVKPTMHHQTQPQPQVKNTITLPFQVSTMNIEQYNKKAIDLNEQKKNDTMLGIKRNPSSFISIHSNTDNDNLLFLDRRNSSEMLMKGFLNVNVNQDNSTFFGMDKYQEDNANMNNFFTLTRKNSRLENKGSDCGKRQKHTFSGLFREDSNKIINMNMNMNMNLNLNKSYNFKNNP